MKKSLTTDPSSPIYIANTPENSNISILDNYISLFKPILGNGIDLRRNRFTLTENLIKSGIKTIVDSSKNDNYMYYIGEMRNFSHMEEKTYQNTKDYIYSLSTSVDANASFPVQMATVSVEANSRTTLEINEHSEIMNLTSSIYNEHAQIDLNQLNFFDKINTPISQDFLNTVDDLIDNHLEIDKIEDLLSSTSYKNFFEKFGTHAISSIVLGSKIDIYYSMKKHDYNKVSDLKVSACVKASTETFTNIYEKYRFGRLGDTDGDFIENNFNFNSLDPNENENGSHMTPLPGKERITYPPETTGTPGPSTTPGAKIEVGFCAGVTTHESQQSHSTDIHSRISILGGTPSLNGQLLKNFTETGKPAGSGIAGNPDIVKDNENLMGQFLASANKADGAGIVDSTYIPIWEFISKLYSISDIEKYYGIKRFQRFINNLINYFSYSSKYQEGIAYYQLTPNGDTPVGYIVNNHAKTDGLVLGSTNIWNEGDDSSANGAPFNFRAYNHGCPDHYESEVYRDGGYKCTGKTYNRGKLCTGSCDRGFNATSFPGCYCEPWDDQKVMYTAATQQLIFQGNPENLEENVITIAKIQNENNYMSIISSEEGKDPISKQAIYGVNKGDLNGAFNDPKCVWKMDINGRIRNKASNYNLCLDLQDNQDHEIWLKPVDNNSKNQQFYLVECDYIKPSDYPKI